MLSPVSVEQHDCGSADISLSKNNSVSKELVTSACSNLEETSAHTQPLSSLDAKFLSFADDSNDTVTENMNDNATAVGGGNVNSEMTLSSTDDNSEMKGNAIVTEDSKLLTKSLTKKDFKQVQNALWKSRTKWMDIGIELNVDFEDLEVIKKNHPNDTDECFRSMVMKLLEKIDPPPTWRVLVDALQSPAVSRAELADTILNQRMYCYDKNVTSTMDRMMMVESPNIVQKSKQRSFHIIIVT